MKFIAYCSVLVLFFATFDSAFAERRVALIIGNSDYQHTPALENPRTDAEALSAKLARLGFEVVAGYDLDHRGARDRLREFGMKVRGAETALFYYAGHAIQADGHNYLLPIDARLEDKRDVAFETLPLDLVLNELAMASRMRLVILDSCRDNPLAEDMTGWPETRSISRSRGLAPVETSASVQPASADTLIAYATRANTTADDGVGQHSPYTTALLEHIDSPGLDVRLMFGRVRDSVKQATANRQEPFVYGSVGGSTWSFNPEGSDAVERDSEVDLDRFQTLLGYWKLIRDTENTDAMLAFLDEYDHPVLRPLVESRLRELGALDAAEPIASRASRTEEPSQSRLIPPKTGEKAHRDLNTEDREQLAALNRAGEIPPRFIQFALSDLGFYQGIADGLIGPQSRQAIRGFQQSQGFSPTGELSNEQRVQLIKAAAAAGKSQSQNTLAIMAGEGVGIPQDWAIAARWFKAAADQGNVFASYNLGVLYRDGKGVEASAEIAKLHFRIAKAGGSERAGKALRALAEE